MVFDRIRVFVLLAIVAGVAVGAGIATSDLQIAATAELGIVLGLMAVGGGVGFWYFRSLQDDGKADERHAQIQYRASTASFCVLLICLGILAATLTITEVAIPVNLVLVGLIFGGILADELFVEYYRRRM